MIYLVDQETCDQLPQEAQDKIKMESDTLDDLVKDNPDMTVQQLADQEANESPADEAAEMKGEGSEGEMGEPPSAPPMGDMSDEEKNKTKSFDDAHGKGMALILGLGKKKPKKDSEESDKGGPDDTSYNI